jgi:hypothetical protein
MWNNKIRKTFIIMICCLVVGIVFFGGVIGSKSANASTASPSHTAATTNRVTTTASPFKVTSIDMSVTPSTTSLWTCGSFIQVVYNAVFHIAPGSNGGTIVFYYTVNNGRSDMPEKVTILPGQRLSNYTFTWQGSLPRDHFYPEPGGVLVSSPNSLVSKMVEPGGTCR